MTCRDNGSTVRAYFIRADGSAQQLESAYLCMESPIRSNHRLSEDFRDTAYLRHRRFVFGVSYDVTLRYHVCLEHVKGEKEKK